jgi:mycothiol maleylpyruvate isomerase-like protein
VADPRELVARLDAAHDAFLEALDEVDADLVTVPGVMQDWSVRDLVVHVAAWSEHGAMALDLATSGRGAEFAYSTDETDALNDGILAAARGTSPHAALDREAAAFATFRERVAGLDPRLLALRLGNGDTVEEVIRYDGPDHYAEHTAHLRAWFGADDDDDDDGD